MKKCNPTRTLSFLLALPLTLISCASVFAKKSKFEDLSFNKEGFTVNVRKYSASGKAKESLLIMPPTGGENFLDKDYARKFSDAGFDVFILKDWTGMDEESIDLDLHNRLYDRGQKAIALTLDHVQVKPVGLLGTSVGGLHAAVAAGMQDRLDSIFVIASGVSIAEIIVNSNQKDMKKLKEERKKKFGYKTDEDYLAALKKNFKFEPTQLGKSFRKKKLGMVVATNDETVPTTNQNKLRQFWKPSKVIEMSNNHFLTIIKSWWYKEDEVLQFFSAQ